MIAWDVGTPISASGVLTYTAPFVRIVLDAVPDYYSHTTDPTPRYRNLGIVGWLQGDARLDATVVRWAQQLIASDTPGTDGLYYVLEPNVTGTLYRGFEVADSLVGARVGATAVQTLGTGANTPIVFDLEVFDPFGLHSNTTNNTRITVQEPGWYQIGGFVTFAANATGIRQISVVKNGTTALAEISTTALGGGNVAKLAIDAAEYLAAGDYVELNAYQDSGGNLNTVQSGSYRPGFWLTRVG